MPRINAKLKPPQKRQQETRQVFFYFNFFYNSHLFGHMSAKDKLRAEVTGGKMQQEPVTFFYY